MARNMREMYAELFGMDFGKLTANESDALCVKLRGAFVAAQGVVEKSYAAGRDSEGDFYCGMADEAYQAFNAVYAA